MIGRAREPSHRLPLNHADYQILLSLADAERHGYGIMQEVAERTGSRLGPGTLYGAIKRLVSAQLVAESEKRPDPELDDERRRYYRITAKGRDVAEAESLRVAVLVRVAKSKGLLKEAF